MAFKLSRFLSGAAKLTQQGHLVDATKLVQKSLTQAFERVAAFPTGLGGVGTHPSPLRPSATRRTTPHSAPGRETPRPPPFRPHTAPEHVVDTDGSFVAGTHAFEGMTRRYKLYTPATLDATPQLVVMLHGCTQDPDDFAAGTRMNEAAERGGFLVLYPEQPRDANPSKCWNWFGTKEQQGGGETAFVADLTRRVIAAEGVDPKRVYVAGLSAGGALAAMVAADNPTLFAAAAVHSGLPPGAAGNLPDALLAMRNGARRKAKSTVPTIVFHGDADHTVHPGNGTAVIDSVLEASPSATGRAIEGDPRVERTVYTEPSGAVVAEHWALTGAGHAWAGGAAAGSHTDPAGIDATGEIVRFFDAHRR